MTKYTTTKGKMKHNPLFKVSRLPSSGSYKYGSNIAALIVVLLYCSEIYIGVRISIML
jgi:hypothetical protein